MGEVNCGLRSLICRVQARSRLYVFNIPRPLPQQVPNALGEGGTAVTSEVCSSWWDSGVQYVMRQEDAEGDSEELETTEQKAYLQAVQRQ